MAEEPQTTEGECFERQEATTSRELVNKDTVDWAVEHEDSTESLLDGAAQVAGVSEAGTVISSVSVDRSSEVQFGNSVIYNAPVTIHQYLVDEKKNKIQSKKATLLDLFQLKKHLVCKTVTIVIGILIVILIIYIYGFGPDPPIETSTEVMEVEDDPKVALTLVSRDQWYGKAPEYNRTGTLPLNLPSTRVIVIHTNTEPCFNMETCSLRMRSIQDYDMCDKKLSDIGYNFLVGGDGRIYVGRGWTMEGSHTPPFNKFSIGLAFIGNFTTELPPTESLNATKLLLDEGVQQYFLSRNYKLFGQRQLFVKESPGEALYKEIQTWPHWTANAHREREFIAVLGSTLF